MEKGEKEMKIILFILLIPSMALSATIHVPGDRPTIQKAINHVKSGDTVLVAPGTYDEAIDFRGKAITVKSSWGPKVTMIDRGGDGSGVIFKNKEGQDSVLNGFTITNCGKSFFGAIYCGHSSPTIMNNIINGNKAAWGGGIRCYLSFSPIIKNNIIVNNSTTQGSGGGISLESSSSPLIMNNIISGNSASQYGGGISCENFCSPKVINNVITHNSAQLRGGGIYCSKKSLVEIVNNTILENSAGSYGGGFYCTQHSSPSIVNTILWNNIAPSGPEVWLGSQNSPSRLLIKYCDVKGGKGSVVINIGCGLTWGPGMMDADPLVLDPANNDFHLTYTSPCKDKGDNIAVSELVDFENDPRIADGTVDIGADEFYRRLYYTGKAAPGWGAVLKFIGSPGSGPVAFFMGNDILKTPIPTIWGDWYLEFPIFGPKAVGTIPANGVLSCPQRIPQNILAPSPFALQGLIGNQLTNPCELMVH